MISSSYYLCYQLDAHHVMSFCTNPGLQLRCPLSLKSVVSMQLDENMLTTPVSALLQKHPEVSGCKLLLRIEIIRWGKWWEWVWWPLGSILGVEGGIMVLEQEVARCWGQKIWKLSRSICKSWPLRGVVGDKTLVAIIGKNMQKRICKSKSWPLLGVVGGSGRLCFSASPPLTKVSSWLQSTFCLKSELLSLEEEERMHHLRQ